MPRTRFLPFAEARAYARAIGLKSWMEWSSWCASGARPKNIPSNPRLFYGDQGGWKGIADWLGYDKRIPVPKHERRKRADCGTRRKLGQQWDSAKEDFFAKLPPHHNFEVRSLPHRSLAQLVYRVRGSQDSAWCPIVLRSAHRLLSAGSVLFDLPKSPNGDGIFFILTTGRRLFFFPHRYLSDRCRRSRDRRLIELKEVEAQEHEVHNAGDLVEILQSHLRSSTLLSEGELSSSRMFSLESDVERHTLMQQAVHFLRSNCGLHVERPPSHSFDAHFVLGDKNIMGRSCRSGLNTVYARVQWSDGESGKRPGCPLRSEDTPEGADFLLGLMRHENHASASESLLRAFFLFPSSYLLSVKYMRKIPTRSATWKRSTLIVYPPWSCPRRAETKATQEEQSKYFVDLSPDADITVAAEKARRLLLE